MSSSYYTFPIKMFVFKLHPSVVWNYGVRRMDERDGMEEAPTRLVTSGARLVPDAVSQRSAVTSAHMVLQPC